MVMGGVSRPTMRHHPVSRQDALFARREAGYFFHHESRRQTDAPDLARGRRQDPRHHRPDAVAASFGYSASCDIRRSRARHSDDASARRAADWRHRGLWLALRDDASDEALERAYCALLATRPTAVNLKWALDEVVRAVRGLPPGDRAAAALRRASELAEEDVAINESIGRHGLRLIEDIAVRKQSGRVNVLTHCNAGWLATVDWGTATAPVYMAHDCGVPVHVFVDETRPRNQGAALTAWELARHGVPHTVIPDNTGGHLMQRGMVDVVIVGADRVTAQGDVCNKIGTYLKALAARDNDVPFYVALPSPTIDFAIIDGLNEIPIEQRGAEEVATVSGKTQDGRVETVQVVPDGTPVANYGFDITPARLVTGLITERGILPANHAALAATFSDRMTGRAKVVS